MYPKAIKSYSMTGEKVVVTYNVFENVEEPQRLVNGLMPFNMPLTIKKSHIKIEDLKNLLASFRKENYKFINESNLLVEL